MTTDIGKLIFEEEASVRFYRMADGRIVFEVVVDGSMLHDGDLNGEWAKDWREWVEEHVPENKAAPRDYRKVAIDLQKRINPKSILSHGMDAERIVETLVSQPEINGNYRVVAIALHKCLWPLGDGSLRGGEDNAAAWVDENARRLASERAPVKGTPEVTEKEAAEGLGKLFGGN